MANPEHVSILRQGVGAWNSWRANFSGRPDLTRAQLTGDLATGSQSAPGSADLRAINFSATDLMEADLTKSDLRGAVLSHANASGASFARSNLSDADLEFASLTGADLTRARGHNARFFGAKLSLAKLERARLNGSNCDGAIFSQADLNGASLISTRISFADFTHAKLRDADLSLSVCVQTSFLGANLNRCRVYGISAWDIRLEGAIQTSLVLTQPGEPELTVDNLLMAHFVYMIISNESLRAMIDTVSSRAVLILGRFTTERRLVLQSIADSMRARNYVPIVFDFDKPASRSLTETVRTLASLSRFIVADITDAKSIPQELTAVVPSLPSVPVQPILAGGEAPLTLCSNRSRITPGYFQWSSTRTLKIFGT